MALDIECCYADCHLCFVLLSATNKTYMLSVIILNVIMLSVVMVIVVAPVFSINLK